MSPTPSRSSPAFAGKSLLAALGVLAATGIYLYGFPDANLFYIGTSIAHAGIGLLAALLLAVMALRSRVWRELSSVQKTGWLLIAGGAVTGVVLVFVGATRPNLPWLYAHIASCVLGLCVLVGEWGARNYFRSASLTAATGVIAVAVMAGMLGWGARYSRIHRWHAADVNVIRNPAMPPVTMAGEGDGENGPFFPSSAQTRDGKMIPAKYFMESKACERCHKDVYQQWNSSVHHLSSFNNQWYRKSIEYMQDVVGTKPSKWCGGCHDPAVLYSGLMDTPIKQIVNRPEAHAGLGCLMCHSIVQVKSTMGQGDFVLEYSKMHELAASENPLMQKLHDFAIYLNPEPHRRAFIKPFMRSQTAEFCSSCHKVHLDVPVNHYRWIRGFNDYDNWQASGVSGLGARSFYYPPKPQDCADCHMPLVKSEDAGNIAGQIHSHRFPAANTALPTAYQDAEQLAAVERFLKDKALSIDIFAISRVAGMAKGGAAVTKPGAPAEQGGALSTTFAVGEEGDTGAAVPGTSVEATAADISAPLDRVHPALRRGETVRVDVVVRTRKVGHFFPGGTVDAFDVWVELKGTDDKGQVVFWNGQVEDGGKGPVEKSAHFYRSLSVDEHGNPINKRNAWASRALVYVRLIPPGAADTVHYRMRVPENAGSKIKLEAKLHYRKFSWYNTQFSYGGEAEGGGAQKAAQRFSPDFDDRKFKLTGDTSGVSGKIKHAPDVPVETLAQSEVELPVVAKGAAAEPKVMTKAEDWDRWNDYGIGLLLQGDLRGAQAAFYHVDEADRKRADGLVNVGRVLVQEGDMQRAREVLERALKVAPDLARTHFFYARVLRSEGKYDEALEHLRKTSAQYPKDRVVHNDMGRILFLQRKYPEAIAEFSKTMAIDPEDLQAHYNLMLCYRGLNQVEQAKEHEKRYLRLKADEAAQALTGPYRNANPEDNTERQAIHEHTSTAGLMTTSAPRAKVKMTSVVGGARRRSTATASPAATAVPSPGNQ